MTVTYTTEDFVRRAVGSLLRGKYRDRFVCSSCLVRLTLERLQTGWRRSEIEAAMEKVFKAPGAVDYMPSCLCARCRQSLPCLGGTLR